MCVNAPEYLESFFAAQKLGAVPVNVNYRYVGAELAYLLDNSDTAALVFHDEFAATVADALATLPADRQPRLLLQVAHAGNAELLAGARDYEAAIAAATAEPPTDARAVRRRPGVRLHGRHDRQPEGRDVAQRRPLRVALADGAAGHATARRRDRDASPTSARRRCLPACPLMHGTGLFIALSTLAGGGTVVLLDTPRLDADAVWDAVERERVQACTIVGDAFARPLLAALDAEPQSLGSQRRCARSRRRASRGARRPSAACSRTCRTSS